MIATKKIQVGIAIAVAIAVAAFFYIFTNPFAMQEQSINGAADSQTNSAGQGQLVVQDEVVGTGTEAKAGDIVSVNYTGKFQDGKVFDSSVGKQPIQFPLGAGYVIPGWDQGLQGMKVGGKRLLIVPPALGYGSVAQGPIPANSTLIFEVELMGVTPPPAQ